LLPFVALIVLSACANAGVVGPEPAVQTGAAMTAGAPTDVELRIGERARVPPVAVTFTRVATDSRCPTGVDCVWEGDAVVELAVGRDDGATASVSLHTNGGLAQEATAAGVRLRLVRLEPYPTAGRPIEAADYRVVLSVAEP